jgi:hypothetical protein
MTEEGKEKGQRFTNDITSDFINRKAEEFATFAIDLEGRPASIEISIHDFAPDLVNFLKNESEHSVTLKGTQEELEDFKKDFPDISALFKYKTME